MQRAGRWVGLSLFLLVVGTQQARALVFIGPGDLSCKTWTLAKDVATMPGGRPWPRKALSGWVEGYLSALAFVSKRPVLDGQSPKVLDAWVDAYCARNTSSSLPNAANLLFNALLASLPGG